MPFKRPQHHHVRCFWISGIQGHVRCVKLGKEVPGHCQRQQIQTTIVYSADPWWWRAKKIELSEWSNLIHSVGSPVVLKPQLVDSSVSVLTGPPSNVMQPSLVGFDQGAVASPKAKQTSLANKPPTSPKSKSRGGNGGVGTLHRQHKTPSMRHDRQQQKPLVQPNHRHQQVGLPIQFLFDDYLKTTD